jgi:hypothetical protein
MGLFSILDIPQASEGAAGINGGEDAGKHSLSLDLPSIVQLYRTNPFRLESAASVPPYSMLSYSAVAMSAIKDDETTPADLVAGVSPSKRSNSNKKAVQAAMPELGVWNVRVARRGGGDSLLLLPPRLAQSVFCFVVDLFDPSQVEPTISMLQDALVRYLIERPLPTVPPAESSDDSAAAAAATSSSTSSFATTTLHDLRTATFGLAPEDAESAARLQKSQPEEAGAAATTHGDRNNNNTRLTLVICARRPGSSFLLSSDGGHADGRSATAATGGGNNSKRVDYKYKQSQALLFYHLRRYAAALNATLCFVEEESASSSLAGGGGGAGSDDHPDAVGVAEQPAIDAVQLAHLWHELAVAAAAGSGKVNVPSSSVLFDLSGGGGPPDDELGSPPSSVSSSFPYALAYTPHNHNSELIESVLLRNAHYPGVWDASKESLWKILPPPGHYEDPDDGGTAPPAGEDDVDDGDDNRWLSELRDSAAASAPPDVTKTPAKTTTSRKEAVPPDSAQKDAAVSSFFESLLK